ncbi:nucleoside hydrolase-like [Diadema antillarum]|uniref:nucleoside hydrolase-like n=1 Tax=Diadema antillarum TaxID=105358 RepID=UPI003A83F7AD
MAPSRDKRLVIIDTDGGTDDCNGILIAAADPGTEILAITCVVGNVEIDQVCRNVERTVRLSDKLCKAKCPIYKGAAENLAGFPIPRFNVHGSDGLGGQGSMESTDSPDTGSQHQGLVQSGPACMALVRIVNEHPGQISVVAIGPLTNLALALRIDPTFSSKIKDLVIMGGDSEGRGNITPCAEFNFCADPEAARVVLREFVCPKTLVSWELTIKYALEMDWMYDNLFVTDTKVGQFLRDTHEFIIAVCKEQPDKTTGGLQDKFPPCDQMAVVICANPCLVTKEEACPCTVEIGGVYSRGHLVIDRGGMDPTLASATPTRIVTEIDFEEFKKIGLTTVADLSQMGSR